MEKYIVVKTLVELNSLPVFKKVQGLLVYCAETNYLYILGDTDQFKVLTNLKNYSFLASNFINLTVYHDLNTPRVNVFAYDYDTGENVNIDWRLGTGFDKPYDILDGYNAITLTASENISHPLYITIMEYEPNRLQLP